MESISHETQEDSRSDAQTPESQVQDMLLQHTPPVITLYKSQTQVPSDKNKIILNN